MKHDYTDEEIRTAWKDSLSLRAFLDALPARLPPLPKTLPTRPPRPEPKASQQEAIDAAFLDSRHISLWAVADSPYWEKEAPDRLALAQVYEQVRPQSAEIVEMRAELDYARKTIEEKSAEIAALKNELAAQAVADVVLTQAVRRMEDVPVGELEKVYWDGNEVVAGHTALKRVCARLIAAVKGEGQAVVVNESPQDERQPDSSGENEKQSEPVTFEAHGKTWTRHTPGDPMPCQKGERIHWLYRDKVTGVTEEPESIGWGRNENKCNDIIGWRYADEPAQPTTSPGWTPAVGDVVRLKSGGPVMTVTDVDPLSLMCAWMNADNELQVEPITTLCLTPVPAP